MPRRPLSAGPETAERPGAGRRALRLALLAGTVALALGACGRRGQPEPPRDPSVPATQKQGSAEKPARGSRRTDTARTEPETTPTNLTNRPLAATQNTSDDDEEDEGDTSAGVSPQPTPTGRKRVRAYQVPKTPFILDPLL